MLVTEEVMAVTQAPSIRSYVLGRGRPTAAQRRAWQLWENRYIIAERTEAVDWSAAFGRHAPLVVEIGCGHGESVAVLARENPDNNYLAFEVYRTGIGALMNRLAADDSDNVRIVCADAMYFLPYMVEPASLAQVNIFFPDPWQKTRHQKRRLVRPSFLAVLANTLKIGGIVHLATDWQDYAEQIRTLFAESENFVAVDAPHRPSTGYERRARQAKRNITDLCYKRAL